MMEQTLPLPARTPGRTRPEPLRAEPAPTRTQLLAFHEASRAVLCFLLYGDQVIREVDLFAEGKVDASRMSTYSLLPIPLVCRPSSGVPRRGNPAPVSAAGIVDSHGILSYAGAVGEILFQGAPIDQASPADALSDDQKRRFALDREALARLADTVRLSRPSDVFYPDYWSEAERLLRGAWPAVAEVAESLCQRGSLCGDRIDEILYEAFPA
ncbi:MAG: hypothetical protein NZ990_14120 [Myxococcota bacterium]|nr:hypothetical protein [Myxococcota bacterium]